MSKKLEYHLYEYELVQDSIPKQGVHPTEQEIRFGHVGDSLPSAVTRPLRRSAGSDRTLAARRTELHLDEALQQHSVDPLQRLFAVWTTDTVLWQRYGLRIGNGVEKQRQTEAR